MQTDTGGVVGQAMSLTPIEQYFVLAGRSDERGLIHVRSVIRFRGALDVGTLEYAINAVVEQNQALRTTFQDNSEGRASRPRFVRLVKPSLVVNLDPLDLIGQSADERVRSIALSGAKEHGRRFDLERGPLCHFELIKADEGEFYLLVTLHHAISDVWSLNILIKELAEHYNSRRARPDLPVQKKNVDFSDYLRWYDKQASAEAHRRATKFWADYLAGFTGNSLQRDLSSESENGVVTFEANWVASSFTLPEPLSAFSKRNGLLSFAAPLLAYAIALSAYAKSAELYILHMISGRFSPAFNDVIGLLIQMLIAKIVIAPEKTAKEMMKTLQLDFLSALPHGAIPILALLPALARIDRSHHRFWTDPNQTKILFNFLHFDNQPVLETLFDGLECEQSPPHDSDPALNEISFFIQCEGAQMHGWLGCWKTCYERATVQEMSEAYRRVLTEIVGQPDCRLGQLLSR